MLIVANVLSLKRETSRSADLPTSADRSENDKTLEEPTNIAVRLLHFATCVSFYVTFSRTIDSVITISADFPLIEKVSQNFILTLRFYVTYLANYTMYLIYIIYLKISHLLQNLNYLKCESIYKYHK